VLALAALAEQLVVLGSRRVERDVARPAVWGALEAGENREAGDYTSRETPEGALI
jgi:hypothetical protein